MYLTIITPCVRYGNLAAIERSINIPKENFRWIVVIDGTCIPKHLPEKCEYYLHTDENSKVGNAQRNFALNLIDDGWVYFNDDDTTLHHLLWRRIEKFENDFISFSQINKDGSLRLKGDVVKLNYIDSHNFVVKRECIGDTRWEIDKYNADGLFAEECYKKSKNPLFIPKVLSIYNSLR